MCPAQLHSTSPCSKDAHVTLIWPMRDEPGVSGKAFSPIFWQPLLHTFFSDTWTGSLEEQQPPGDVRDKPKEDVPGANCLPEILLRLPLASQSHHASKGIQDLPFHPSRFPILLNGITTPAVAAAAKSLQSCPTLCDPIDGSPPGSPVPGILQTRTLEWVAISFSNAWKWKVKVKSLSRVRLLATPWTAASQAFSIHGIFQARGLEWVAIAFSTPAVKTDQKPGHCAWPTALKPKSLILPIKISLFLWGLSSPTRDQTQPPSRESPES